MLFYKELKLRKTENFIHFEIMRVNCKNNGLAGYEVTRSKYLNIECKRSLIFLK